MKKHGIPSLNSASESTARMAGPRARRVFATIMIAVTAALSGCTYMAEQPEIAPDRYAPANAEARWAQSAAQASDRYAVNSVRQPGAATVEPPPPIAPNLSAYDLPALVDMALSSNPSTRSAWESARAAAAEYGASRAPYYPMASVDTPSGYSKILFELPVHASVVKQWQSSPMIELTYTILDFGRRSAGADLARNELIAANFTFDRRLQDVVFNVERNFYALDAAHAAVTAAQQNL